jgi:DNA replication licensing factor MCM7
MDEADDGIGAQGNRTRNRQKSKMKYVEMLQDVADRETSHITIDLDDLELVSDSSFPGLRTRLSSDSTRKRLERRT